MSASVFYPLKGTTDPLFGKWDNKTVSVASSGSNCGWTDFPGEWRRGEKRRSLNKRQERDMMSSPWGSCAFLTVWRTRVTLVPLQRLFDCTMATQGSMVLVV